jgi:hypothetical protein
VAGLEVKHDGQALNPALLGSAFPVDPGSHLVEASAPGRSSWASKVAIERGAKVTVEVPVLGEATRYPEPTPAASTVGGPPAPGVPAPVDQPAPPGRTQRWLGIGVGAAGVAAIGVGLAFGASARSKNNEAHDQHCNDMDQCDQTGVDLVDDAKSAAMLSTILTGAGIAAVAGGVALYLLAPSGETARAALRVAPAVDGRSVGIAVSGGF